VQPARDHRETAAVRLRLERAYMLIALVAVVTVNAALA
jgi:hypothetical protein